jgi:hypothetical protein
MSFKITLLFQQSTGIDPTQPGINKHIGGWSESVYSGESDIAVVRAKLFTAGSWGIGLCPARAALLSQFGQIVGQRILQVAPSAGRAQTSNFSFPGGTEDTDVPQMALQCSAAGVGVVNVRHFSMRGIPDAQVKFGEFYPSPAYANAVSVYFTELQNWRFRGQDLTAAFADVATIDVTGLVTLPAITVPFGVGDQVQFRGLKADGTNQPFSLKGFVAAVPTVNTFTLRNFTAPPSHGGQVRKVSYFLYLMGTPMSVDRAAVRKVGRPFFQYRGRRSKRKVIA